MSKIRVNGKSGPHWKKSDFNHVIMTTDKTSSSMGQKLDTSSQAKGAAVTDYSK